MSATTIEIVSDNATPALQAMLERLGPQAFGEATGPALVNLTRTHLAGMGTNKKNWPSTGFYEKFSENTRWLPDPKGVVLAILPAVINGRVTSFRRHVFGGEPIVPTEEAKALALPISPVSYGHTPKDFPGLFLLRTKKGAYLVQHGETTTTNKKGQTRTHGIGRAGGGNVARRRVAALNFLFKLVGSTNPAAKREALPSDEQLLDTAANAAQRWIVHGEKAGGAA